MPLYDYKCNNCGKILRDIKQQITDTSDYICPVCNKPMNKIITKSYFELKGKGWFKDGYNK